MSNINKRRFSGAEKTGLVEVLYEGDTQGRLILISEQLHSHFFVNSARFELLVLSVATSPCLVRIYLYCKIIHTFIQRRTKTLHL